MRVEYGHDATVMVVPEYWCLAMSNGGREFLVTVEKTQPEFLFGLIL